MVVLEEIFDEVVEQREEQPSKGNMQQETKPAKEVKVDQATAGGSPQALVLRGGPAMDAEAKNVVGTATQEIEQCSKAQKPSMDEEVEKSVEQPIEDEETDEAPKDPGSSKNKKRKKLSKKKRKRKANKKTESHFRFLNLPGEIRNIIYRYCLTHVACCGHTGFIHIHSLGFEEYQAALAANQVKLRTTYATLNMLPTSGGSDKYGQLVRTTYQVKGLNIPSFALLGVNRQTRHEALPIFFGENNFSFVDMAALVPFLEDQIPTARMHIKSMFFILHIFEDGLHLRRQESWCRAFQYVATHHRHLSTLCVDLTDVDERLRYILRLNTKGMRWVRALTKIQNLETLRFTFTGKDKLELFDDDEYDEYMAEMSDDYDSIVSWDHWTAFVEMKEDLSLYLACKMLKNPPEDAEKIAGGIWATHSV